MLDTIVDGGTGIVLIDDNSEYWWLNNGNWDDHSDGSIGAPTIQRIFVGKSFRCGVILRHEGAVART